MNKTILKILIVLITLFFINCKKDIVEIYHPIQIYSTIKNVSEFGNNDGEIDITVSGGSQPYEFKWSNHQTSEDITGLAVGVYSIIVTDSDNFFKSDTFDVTQPEPDPIIVTFEITSPSETGANDGSINTVLEGGFPPFSFLWSNGSDAKDMTNLSTGIYILTITDSKGQTRTDSVTLIDYIIDIDKNIYSKIKIGNQIWMGENLKVKRTPDSTIIESHGYNDDTSYVEIYGRLYTWNTAMNGLNEEKSQGICPSGWHIPSDEEFKELEIFLGMTPEEADQSNMWRSKDVGTRLKFGGSSGYEAQLSGRRSYTGSYDMIDCMEYIWTSNEYGNNAWRRCLDKNAGGIGRANTFPKTYGLSVRCIKTNED